MMRIINSLLPNYMKNLKQGDPAENDLVNGYNGNMSEQFAEMIKNNPAMQEQYKNSGGFIGPPVGANLLTNLESNNSAVGGPALFKGNIDTDTTNVKARFDGAGNAYYPWDPEFASMPIRISESGTPIYENDVTAVEGQNAPQSTFTKSLNVPSSNVEGVNDPQVAFSAKDLSYAPANVEGINAPKFTDAKVTAPNPNDVNADNLNDKYLQAIMEALNGGAFPGTENAVSGQRETMAAFAKDLKAKAGMDTAKRGGIGQGTQAGSENAANMNIMQQLASTERDIAGMRADDQRKALDMARGAYEGDRTFNEGTREFDITQGEGARQFDDTLDYRKEIDKLTIGRSAYESDRAFDESQRTFDAGLALQKEQLVAQTSQDNLNRLQQVAGDNPYVLSKLIDVSMGKEGISFTPDEMKGIEEYYKGVASRQEALNKADTILIEALPELLRKDIESRFEPTTTEKLEDRLGGGDFTKLQPEDWGKMSPELKQEFYDNENFIKESNFVSPSVNQLEGGVNKASVDVLNKNPWLKDSAGKYIEIGSKLYKIGDPPVVTHSNNAGWLADTRYRQQVNLIDIETGLPATSVLETPEYD